MDKVLLVSSFEKNVHILNELLSQSYNNIITAISGSEARRILIENDFDLCIINTPLCDEFGTDLALYIADYSITQVMILVKSEIADEISLKVEDYGVFTLSKPLGRQAFWSALKLISAAHKKILGMKSENTLLRQKIEDLKLIDRAKCILIEYLKITEQEAHKYIEKQAMDMRITKKEVATAVLKTYESAL